jgi:hypothetical protein
MAKIILFGECHVSKKDAERLMSYDFSEIAGGIFFAEGRDEDISNKDNNGPLYYLYLLGYLELFHKNWLYNIINWIRRRPDIGQLLRAKSVEHRFIYDNHIDAPLSRIYYNVKGQAKVVILLLLACLLSLMCLCIMMQYYLGIILWVIVIPFIYFGLIVFPATVGFSDNRGQYMAEHIDKRLREEGRSIGMVFCGKEHVDEIRKYLEGRGHTVLVESRKE